ncbi:sigma-70 family RNA polymerase sigma factor [Actinomadura barringtoniae]|uniref:Sigma-70 family RNA polymerase sigma factor n=2 Tax=Actinomadura barringtoniae TaxID=1427535 RepID=A0A939P9X4_9ACTN|nr:sigma-70 family RNA polymerase sigma factor [Actinomadura barringtoniae]
MPEPERLDGTLEQATSVFTRTRPRLFGIAYRVLGSVAEAEDVVQDTWLRWQGADRPAIANPTAFLALITTRLAINISKSARSQRETSIGPWLPERVGTGTDPALEAERGEALELALLLLLQRLTPTERAAYILREAFDYPYAQIAEVLQVSPVNTRQLVTRARKHLTTARRGPIDRAEHRRLVEIFLSAAQTGDTAALEDHFAANAAGPFKSRGRGAMRSAALHGDRVA